MTDRNYEARIEPQADGGWAISIWSLDPFYERSAGAFPRSVAERLGLGWDQTERWAKDERRARKLAVKMLAECERRHAAKYDRKGFRL